MVPGVIFSTTQPNLDRLLTASAALVILSKQPVKLEAHGPFLTAPVPHQVGCLITPLAACMFTTGMPAASSLYASASATTVYCPGAVHSALAAWQAAVVATVHTVPPWGTAFILVHTPDTWCTAAGVPAQHLWNPCLITEAVLHVRHAP